LSFNNKKLKMNKLNLSMLDGDAGSSNPNREFEVRKYFYIGIL